MKLITVDRAAAVLGRKGGKRKSKAKTIAARQNGQKGGWPLGRKRGRGKK